MNRIIIAFASGLGTGYSPIAPGTVGSLLAIPLVLMLLVLPLTTYLVTVITFVFMACWFSEQARQIYKVNDSPKIVIDEIAGMLVVFIGQGPSLLTVITGFVLFRVLDVWKPWPCRWIDHKLHNGYGIVLDDVAAGVYANLLLWILAYFFPQI